MKNDTPRRPVPKGRKPKAPKNRKSVLNLDATLIQENMDELKDFLARHRVLPHSSEKPLFPDPVSPSDDLFRQRSSKKEESPSTQVYETYVLRGKKPAAPARKKKA